MRAITTRLGRNITDTEDTPSQLRGFTAAVAYRSRRRGRPHGGTMSGSTYAGRHRLGAPGLVHCVRHRPVALALVDYRRGWLTALLVPAKHSLAGLRRRASARAIDRAWVPATT